MLTTTNTEADRIMSVATNKRFLKEVDLNDNRVRNSPSYPSPQNGARFYSSGLQLSAFIKTQRNKSMNILSVIVIASKMPYNLL